MKLKIKLLTIVALIFLLSISFASSEELCNWNEVEQFFAQSTTNNDSIFSFTLNNELLNEMEKDTNLLSCAAARAGYEEISWSWWKSGRVEVTSMIPFDCPFRTVQTTDELIAAISEMRQIEAKKFVILADKNLYTSLKNDKIFARTLLYSGGLFSWKSGYSKDSNYSYKYEDCKYWFGAVRSVQSESEVLSAMKEIGSLGYDAFALVIDQATYNSLMTSDSARLHAIMDQAFVDSSFTYNSENRILVFFQDDQSVFNPGYVILRAWKGGYENNLPKRLKQTLDYSLNIVSGISGTTRETVIAIHDFLCSHITYQIDESTEEDDHCIGAILNGEANCDGYSEAFMLLCGLKNIPVKMVTGDSLNNIDLLNDPSHMWNLVFMDELWRGVDVTWDDNDKNGTISYENFNMGIDRMKRNYIFSDVFWPSDILNKTDLIDRPVPEFKVSAVNEIHDAIHKTLNMGKTQAVLWLSDELYTAFISADGSIWEWLDFSGVTGNISHSDKKHQIIVSDISPLDQSITAVRADSENSIIALIRSAAASGVKELRIYCTEALYARYHAADNPIQRWMDLAGANGKSSYSDNIHRITITEITAFDPGIQVQEADTEDEIIRLMYLASNAQLQELRVYCSVKLYTRYQDTDYPIWKWMDLAGISGNVSYSDTAHMIALSEITLNESGIIVAETDTPDQLINFLLSADWNTVTEVRIYCSDILYSQFEANRSIIWDWLKRGNVSNASVSYSDARKFISCTNIKWGQ